MYFYGPKHISGTCPAGANAILPCTIEVLENSSVNVQWYWTQNVEDAGIQGALIQTNGSDKYFQTTRTPDAVRVFNELFINNFTTNDTGFYWCQMVINESILLEPSCPIQLTAVQTNDTECTATGTKVAQQCVNVTIIPITSQLPLPTPNSAAQTTTAPMSSVMSNRITTSTPGQPMQTGEPSSSSQCEVGGTSCSAVYGAVGAAAVVVLVGGTLVGLLGCLYLTRKKLVGGKGKLYTLNS